MNLTEILEKGLRQVHGLLTKDIAAMTDEQLSHKPREETRSAFDVVYEVGYTNNRMATRLKGEDPGPWPFGDAWATVPDELANRDAIAEYLNSSVENLISSIGEDPTRTMTTPMGDSTALEQIQFAAIHMAYHSGQLNCIQTLHGDTAMHWM